MVVSFLTVHTVPSLHENTASAVHAHAAFCMFVLQIWLKAEDRTDVDLNHSR